MKRVTSARTAGATFLAYIAAAFPANAMLGRATGAGDTAAQLAGIAAHAADVRIVILLTLVSCFAAVVLAVTLYGVTRDEDHELATLGLCCRLGEGVLGGVMLLSTVGLLTLATAGPAGGPAAGPAAAAADAAGREAIASFLLRIQDSGVTLMATFFAVGSTAFAWLLLRGRMIPAWLAWLGVLASVLLVVSLPLRLAGFAPARIMLYLWLPMAAFEIPLGVWLLVKGVRTPAARLVPVRAVAGTVEPA